MRPRILTVISLCLVAMALASAADAEISSPLPSALESCVNTAQTDFSTSPGFLICAWDTTSNGWSDYGGTVGQSFGSAKEALDNVFSGSYITCQNGEKDCVTFLGTFNSDQYLFSTAPGIGIDFDSGQVISTSENTGTWVGESISGFVAPLVPVSAYANNLLSWIVTAASDLWLYAAIVTALVVSLIVLKRWLGNRRATQV